ncbi:MAG: helix-turn-helix transcriptional regulator [Clostridia bacterium]|nr:helix-turn-helix transcriptional regulator [Clostridia bacterium]
MKKNINLEIGERVRITRNSRGFSREVLAEMLGISTLFLGYIECGQRGMSIETLQKMCTVLNVSADYIILGKDAQSDSLDGIINAVKEFDPKYHSLVLESINHLKRIITLSGK